MNLNYKLSKKIITFVVLFFLLTSAISAYALDEISTTFSDDDFMFRPVLSESLSPIINPDDYTAIIEPNITIQDLTPRIVLERDKDLNLSFQLVTPHLFSEEKKINLELFFVLDVSYRETSQGIKPFNTDFLTNVGKIFSDYGGFNPRISIIPFSTITIGGIGGVHKPDHFTHKSASFRAAVKNGKESAARQYHANLKELSAPLGLRFSSNSLRKNRVLYITKKFQAKWLNSSVFQPIANYRPHLQAFPHWHHHMIERQHFMPEVGMYYQIVELPIDHNPPTYLAVNHKYDPQTKQYTNIKKTRPSTVNKFTGQRISGRLTNKKGTNYDSPYPFQESVFDLKSSLPPPYDKCAEIKGFDKSAHATNNPGAVGTKVSLACNNGILEDVTTTAKLKAHFQLLNINSGGKAPPEPTKGQGANFHYGSRIGLDALEHTIDLIYEKQRTATAALKGKTIYTIILMSPHRMLVNILGATYTEWRKYKDWLEAAGSTTRGPKPTQYPEDQPRQDSSSLTTQQNLPLGPLRFLHPSQIVDAHALAGASAQAPEFYVGKDSDVVQKFNDLAFHDRIKFFISNGDNGGDLPQLAQYQYDTGDLHIRQMRLLYSQVLNQVNISDRGSPTLPFPLDRTAMFGTNSVMDNITESYPVNQELSCVLFKIVIGDDYRIGGKYKYTSPALQAQHLHTDDETGFVSVYWQDVTGTDQPIQLLNHYLPGPLPITEHRCCRDTKANHTYGSSDIVANAEACKDDSGSVFKRKLFAKLELSN